MKEVLGRFVSNYVMAVQGEYLDRLHTMYERTREMLDRLSKRLQVSDPGNVRAFWGLPYFSQPA